MSRYERQIRLNEVGEAGQRRLAQASVLVIGAGGLGSPVLYYLAAAGVGRIAVVDFDRVEESNLHRQVIHGTSDLGELKVVSAQKRLREINPHVEVVALPVRLTQENGGSFLDGVDVVVDACDNFSTRYALDDICRDRGIPLVYGAIFRFDGHVSVFHYRGGPGYRDLYPDPPGGVLAPTCSEAGVLGALPGIVGSIQSAEVLKILLDIGEVLSGRLLVFDALTMRFHEVEFSASADPPISAAPRYVEISAVEVHLRRVAGWSPFVIDVRSAEEVAIKTIGFADEACPVGRISAIAARVPTDRDVLVYCRSGVRSAAACEALYEHGLRRLFSLGGGLVAWDARLDRDAAPQ